MKVVLSMGRRIGMAIGRAFGNDYRRHGAGLVGRGVDQGDDGCLQ